MRTYKCTLVTLDTSFWIPFWNRYSSTTFFVCGSTKFELSVSVVYECRYWQAVTIHDSDRFHHFSNHLNCLWTSYKFFSRSIWSWIRPGSWNLYFMNSIYTSIDCFVVHLYNSVTLLAVGLLSCCFHEFYCFVDRHDVR